jgi:amino acid adenylation domain-containing protein
LGSVAPHAYIEYDLQDIDFPRLMTAWRRMIERHDTLRTIVLEDGRQQVLAEVPELDVPVQDLRPLDPGAAEAIRLEARREMSHRGPTPERWPLFEMRAFRLGERHYRLHWSSSLLICDDWSYHVLSEEWFRLYRRPDDVLPELEVSFRDYVMALQNFEASPAYQRSLEHWRERIAELPPAPDLPLRRDPSEVGPPRFERRSRRLSRDTWQRLRQKAQRLGVTPSAVLCTAYTQVLATWSRHRRFTLNLLFFNRFPLHPQIDQVVGNFSSTLALAVDADAGASFGASLTALQRRLWQDLEHSRVSGIRVLRELGRRQGGTSRAALPVVFASNLNAGFDDEEEAAVGGVRSVYSHLQTAQVWLDHQVFELKGGLYFNWDAVADLFPEGMVQAMFDAYCHLLDTLAEREEAWDEPLPPLLPEAQRVLRAAINNTAAPVPEATLPGLFAESLRALTDPEAQPAVIAAGSGGEATTLSYGDLERRAAAVAARLQRDGLQRGERVAVMMDKGWEQVPAVLGITRAGGAYLPIDPALPEARRRHLLEHGNVRQVLTQDIHQATFPWPAGVRAWTLAEVESRVAGAESAELPSPTPPTPDDLAYILYTSGSTGQPKGVVIDHRGAVNTVVDINRRWEVGSEDRIFGLSSLSFDLSVYDIFGALGAGGTVVLPDPQDLREPGAWQRLLETHGVTVWNSVPALLQMLVDHVEGRGERLPASLRLLLLSGDWVPVDLARRVRRLSPRPDLTILSLGGATEASIWSIYHPIAATDPEASPDPLWPSVPYGRPLTNQTFHVLDEALRPRPDWVPGELFIGGVGLARGYHRDETQTRHRFLEHPRTGERLYRTGDLGRYHPEGDIEFLGRVDFQVKVQGYRIELGEIEANLLGHPVVRQTVAVALDDGHGEKRLVAYVVPEGGDAPETEALRTFLTDLLPAYMVPRTFVFLEALPLSANGKVDRRALPAPDEAGSPAATAFVAPRDALEESLAALWRELLPGDEPLGVFDNFFDAGGHSLLAVRLMARIQQEHRCELPLSVLLEGPTLDHLAAVVRRHQQGEGGSTSPLVAIRPQGDGRPFFCVHPSGGNVLCYAALARHLGELEPRQPFYGLQAPGLQPGASPGGTVEERAELYRQALQAVQPHGPYRLGGWSMGGVVAFEMARQFLAQGEAVERVVLIDASAPTGAPPQSLDDAALAAHFTADLAAAGTAAADLPAADLERLRGVFIGNYRAMLQYRPEPLPVPLLLIRARRGLAVDDPRPDLGWGPATAALTVEEIDGDHYSIVQPPAVATLAALVANA